MTRLATTDLCDTYGEHVKEGQLRVLQPVFQSYGSRRAFSGAIATVKVFEDNVLVRATLEEEGHGRVLVVDGGGSLRCALMGGNLAALAQSNGWSGVVVNGCVRDVDEINRCDIGVRALAAHPLKSNKKGVGEKNGIVYVAGARIVAGEWCCADADGVIVAPTELSL
uniref:4-hydroxy-4-methyl-2-oxoglutarate aldolase n=1 Tax=Wollemia nobilis TaxID=56998 RepID=A0A0C9QLP2_9CONI